MSTDETTTEANPTTLPPPDPLERIADALAAFTSAPVHPATPWAESFLRLAVPELLSELRASRAQARALEVRAEALRDAAEGFLGLAEGMVDAVAKRARPGDASALATVRRGLAELEATLARFDAAGKDGGG